MKFSVDELNRKASDIYIDEELDFSDKVENEYDIYSISKTTVQGTVSVIGEDTFMFNLHVKTTLDLACSVTLEHVTHPLDIYLDEIFARDYELDDDINLIENNTIELNDAIFAAIMLEKPLKVVSSGAENIYESSEELSKQEKKQYPFAGLKDFLEEKE